MKVLCAEFVTESNANIPLLCTLKDYNLGFGQDCIDKMRIEHVFKENDIELIPSVFANAGASGVVEETAFHYIEDTILKDVKENLSQIDGIFLMLHGASEVENIGSGDHHILQEIRKITGPYLPIAVVCDPHGNLCQEYTDNCTILRSYRESPHTDADETMEHVAKLLCDLLKNRQNIHAVYRKLPLILGGEQSVSADEPVRSINAYMDELEKDPRILSCSWHVGYIRHDCDVAGCGIVVVPATGADIEYANEVADDLAKYVWERRHEFHYTGLTREPQEALDMALAHDGKPVFITDSGDNVTSGAAGWNTYVLRQMLEVADLKKKVLFATICDPDAYEALKDLPVGATASIDLGVGYDELSKPVKLEVEVLSKGELNGFMMHDPNSVFGQVVTVHVVNTNIDIIIANTNWSVCEWQQFPHLNVDPEDYDLFVVKQGYIFPDFKEKGSLCVMSLTQGATLQNTAALPFKRIARPMFPIDNI